MEDMNPTTRFAPRRLRTEADLHRDQLEFFRSSNMLPSQQQEEEIDQDATDEYDLATLSMSRTARTPTSSLLPEITERKVAPRRKRRQQAKQQPPRTGFPTVEEIGEKQSLFSSKRQEKRDGDEETKFKDMSAEVRETVAAMSLEEIQQAQQEIYASLKPENIEFLKQRRQKSKKKGDEQNTTHKTGQNNNSIEGSNTNVHKDDQKSSSERDIQLANNEPISEKKKMVETIETDSSSTLTTNQEGNDVVNDNAKKTNMDLAHLLQIGKGNPDTTKEEEEHEKEKRKWMTDSSEHIESQASMDTMLEGTVKSLGSIGMARFNLDGQILTEEEIDNLPTHAGLHHHGSNPERAGYTLVDVLTLTRSTVVTQRIISLKILTGMIQKYGNTITDPLINSDGLALIFSPFPSLTAFHAALTSHISFVEMAEAVITLKSESEKVRKESDLYFASSYYSTSLFDKADSKLFDLLSESGCLPTLIQIAVKNSAPNANNELSVRALCMVKAIITHCESASQKILNDDVTIKGLMSIAQGYNETNLQIVPHACEVLKHVSLITAWNDQGSLDKLDMTVFSDQYLHKLAIHLEVLLHEIPAQVSAIRLQCACSTVHVFRAALTFERGILPFAAILQPISALCSYPNNIALNSYLALEAYVHSLYTRASNSNNNQEQGESGVLKSYDQKLEADFLNNQVAGLVPMAVSALTVFTESGSRHSTQKKAAAGHFSATLFASGGMLQDKSVVAKIFNTCTQASLKIIYLRNNRDNIHEVQSYASVSHAGVRLLSKIKLELGYVKREIEALWGGLLFESDILSERSYGKFWRPLANCCAEWAGALSRTECNINSVERCLQLLPFLSDNQVIVDLLARGVLQVDALKALNSEISVEDRQRCAKELLPATLTELNSRLITIRHSSPEEETHTATAQIDLKDLIRLWSKHEDTFHAFEIFSKAIYKRNLVHNSTLLAALLNIPKSYYESKENPFHGIFKVARECTTKEERLVDNTDETVVSSKSTTDNSRLATAILGLADFLVLRGPHADFTSVDGKQIDTLASVVLAFLLREEIDVSLRISLWRKTIEDCGGGFLFKEAVFLREGAFKNESDEVDMLFFQSFCVGVQQGLFLGERSPNVLREAFCIYLATKLTRSGHESEVLRDAIQINTEACLESMHDILQIESVSSHERDFIVSWLSQNGLQIN